MTKIPLIKIKIIKKKKSIARTGVAKSLPNGARKHFEGMAKPPPNG
jgi:hypothetical protein